MAIEVNNLAYPYSAVVHIRVFFSEQDYNNNIAGQGSGVLIDQNDVLTASHVVYDTINNRLPYRIEVTPAYDKTSDGNPNVAEAPFGTFIGKRTHFFNTIDADRNGFYLPGDNNPGTLFDTEQDVAVITLAKPTNTNLPTMAFGSGFTQGNLNLAGYPGSANGSPMQETGFFTKSAVDNSILTNGVTLGPGSSGGPAWSAANNTVYGVISSTGALTHLAAHANWIRELARLNDDFFVGSAASDIFRPWAGEFFLNKPPGFASDIPFQYFIQSMLSLQPFWGVLGSDGKEGIDTIALPWDKDTGVYSNAALIPKFGPSNTTWKVTWSKAANGTISGSIQQGSSATSFTNFERLAFSDNVYDLTTSQVGVQYSIGPLAAATVVTSLDQLGPNPVTFNIQSFAGDASANELLGTLNIDHIYGFEENDHLIGLEGNDSLYGGPGDDTLVGNEGIDEAVFAGPRSAYQVTNLGGGDVRVVGPEGDDLISSIEKLVFDDAKLNWPQKNEGDFNADAFGDILWRNASNGQVRTWELDGTGGAATDNYGGTSLAWQQIAADDFNGDGLGDILWRNTTTGEVATWELDGAGGFLLDRYGAANVVWQAVGSGDFNADGKGDVLFRNTATGQVATWELDGDDHFSYDSYGAANLAWKVAGIGDFNADGKDDILWRNSTTGQVATWELNGAGGFSIDHYGAANLAWHIYDTGDFNADGRDDILFRNNNGQVSTWELNGTGGFSVDSYGVAGSVWSIMDATDTNSDGKDDILWRNTATGQVAAWELNGAGGFAYQGYAVNVLDWQIFDGNFQFV